MNLLLKTYRLFAITAHIVVGCLLLISSYSYLIPPSAWKLPIFMALAFPVFFYITITLAIGQLIVRPRKYALIPLVFIIICSPAINNYFPIHISGKDNGNPKITIMSYNIMMFGETEKTKNGTSNNLLDWINQYGADIVCLQEYCTAQKTGKHRPTQQQVNNALSAYPHKYITYPQNSNIGLACYSKYPIQKAQAVPFYNTKTPHRACIYHIDIDGKTLHLINCHMQSNQLNQSDRELYTQIARNPSQTTDLLPQVSDKLLRKLSKAAIFRAEQAQIIEKIIGETPNGITVCGDFNDTPQSYTYRKIRGDMHDAYVTGGFGPGITYNSNGFWFRIDHIIHDNQLNTIDCHIPHIKMSDHYPIIATIQWD